MVRGRRADPGSPCSDCGPKPMIAGVLGGRLQRFWAENFRRARGAGAGRRRAENAGTLTTLTAHHSPGWAEIRRLGAPSDRKRRNFDHPWWDGGVAGLRHTPPCLGVLPDVSHYLYRFSRRHLGSTLVREVIVPRRACRHPIERHLRDAERCWTASISRSLRTPGMGLCAVMIGP